MTRRTVKGHVDTCLVAQPLSERTYWRKLLITFNTKILHLGDVLSCFRGVG
jgi:hypothetical protein